VTRLNNGLDQLGCTLVQELGESEPVLARLPGTDRAAMRLSPVVENFRLYSAEVLGNTLLRPEGPGGDARVADRLGVKPVDPWPCARVPYEVEDHLSAERRRSRPYLERQESKHISLMENPDYRLLRQGAQAAPGVEHVRRPDSSLRAAAQLQGVLGLG